MADFAAYPTGVEGLQAVSGKSAHCFPRHTHDDFGIGLVISGGQMSASGRGQVEAGPGHVITVNPGEVHDGAPVRGEPRQWHMFYLTPALVDQIAEGLDVARAAALEFHNPVMADAKAARRFAVAWQGVVGDGISRPSPEAVDELLLTCLHGLLGNRRGGHDAHLATDRIARLRAMIDDDVAGEHSLKRLANEAGLSRFQTLRAFARATGFTPHAYLVERRTQLARRLILAGNPLADAAAASGFADQSHMTRAFRQRYGLTPAAARKAAQSAIPFKT
ncbi:AraC family transcriptional regulator [Rhizobium sp. C4]|uniref:AraC family transcriptional regulator n=1 Tax=Rhizobium sp. C4 TaxID=1349800 RepID=UPI001E2B2E13|nr:AraC family transcriptional regulator [Rhizobium sp. C4]MCD2173724.1 AraC family transcriptional regulator [Rhizobium sp. C4]